VATCAKCDSGQPAGILYAINPGGRSKWNLTIPNTGEGVDTLSSPTIGPDGTIYTEDEGFRVVAVHSDGSVKWELSTPGEARASPALATDGTVYVGIDDPSPSGLCGECLAALNPDGTVKWGSGTGQVENSSPVVGPDGTIYIGSTFERFSAVRPDGSTRWNLTGSPSETFDQTAAIGPNGTVYAVSLGESFVNQSFVVTTRVYALRSDGALLWTYSNKANAGPSSIGGSSPSIGSDGILYLGIGGDLIAITPSGNQLWNFSTNGVVESSPAIGSNGTIYVGSDDGNLYAISNAPS
jgi:outer membrane protein assembly factor BamB